MQGPLKPSALPIRIYKKGTEITYNCEQIWIAVQRNNSERVEPLPHLVCFLAPRQTIELFGLLIVDGLW
jgi:hypothetical protein